MKRDFARTLVVRLTAEQLEEVRERAALSGLSLSAWARTLILRELNKKDDKK